MDLVLVAAVAENGVIGADGEMPWYYPADLEHFRTTTTGHPVVMGRRTFESIVDRLGEPLPDRTSIVLTSRSPEDLPLEPGSDREDVMLARSIDGAIDAAKTTTGADVTYVLGGGSVYEQFLPRADRLLLTEIPESYEGDTYFPEFDEETWVEADRDEQGDLAFVTYERRMA